MTVCGERAPSGCLLIGIRHKSKDLPDLLREARDIQKAKGTTSCLILPKGVSRTARRYWPHLGVRERWYLLPRYSFLNPSQVMKTSLQDSTKDVLCFVLTLSYWQRRETATDMCGMFRTSQYELDEAKLRVRNGSEKFQNATY
jgi:hypothetical protein